MKIKPKAELHRTPCTKNHQHNSATPTDSTKCSHTEKKSGLNFLGKRDSGAQQSSLCPAAFLENTFPDQRRVRHSKLIIPNPRNAMEIFPELVHGTAGHELYTKSDPSAPSLGIPWFSLQC